MTPQELRTSVLQLAFQGKLVPQHLEDGVAAELLQAINRIKTDKQLKKEKASTHQIRQNQKRKAPARNRRGRNFV